MAVALPLTGGAVALALRSFKHSLMEELDRRYVRMDLWERTSGERDRRLDRLERIIDHATAE